MEVGAVILGEANSWDSGRLDLVGRTGDLSISADPLDALVLGVSLNVPIYLDSMSRPVPDEPSPQAQRRKRPWRILPKVIPEFIGDTEVLRLLGDGGEDQHSHSQRTRGKSQEDNTREGG
jgi:hypothetical protein